MVIHFSHRKSPGRKLVLQVWWKDTLLIVQLGLKWVCMSVLPACPEVKVNEITTAANLLPSPTGPNEPQLRSISRL